MDTQSHIMDFIFKHQDIFKIPASVLDDSELKSSLCAVVSRFLATIHSYLKLQVHTELDRTGPALTDFDSKVPNWLDLSRQNRGKGSQQFASKSSGSIFVRTDANMVVCSGMDLEAAHWNRMAFLHHCLHICLIGTGNLKNIPLNDSFTPHLVPMLKIAHPEVFTRDNTTDLGLMEVEEEVDDADIDTEGGLWAWAGCARFWNYINYMLNLLCVMAYKITSMKEEFKKEVASIMVKIFQDDLLDCPSHRKVMRLTVVNPQWKTTVQHGLMW
ncbi:hypothetical protein EDC04DRAFT_2611769 [Pisolithus marmoratus]|nr:hypothetical protein EDC04DRAFT_2611769 [Pisolithus marmoratus]